MKRGFLYGSKLTSANIYVFFIISLKDNPSQILFYLSPVHFFCNRAMLQTWAICFFQQSVALIDNILSNAIT